MSSIEPAQYSDYSLLKMNRDKDVLIGLLVTSSGKSIKILRGPTIPNDTGAAKLAAKIRQLPLRWRTNRVVALFFGLCGTVATPNQNALLAMLHKIYMMAASIS